MKWNFDPLLVSYEGLSLHWYGLIFAIAVSAGYHITKLMFAHESRPQEKLDNLFFYVLAGVIIGARIGHCFFYDPLFYFSNPIKIFAIWEGGLASHGGGLGAILGIFIYSQKYKTSFIWLLDRIVVPTALFGVFVRFANFLNSEIIGAKSDLPWAVVFERVDAIPRHPAQLYESLGYFVVFILLLVAYSKSQLKERSGAMLGLFLTMIFAVRFLVEYIKEPQASYTLGFGFNTGQLLSIPFLIVGVLALTISLLRKRMSLNGTELKIDNSGVS